MQMTNKYYDVVTSEGKLIARGFAQMFIGDDVQVVYIGPFGSGVRTYAQSQLRPYNSVPETANQIPARTAPSGMF